MKILFLSNKTALSGKAVGGAETSMEVMAQSMSELGHDVYYLAWQHPIKDLNNSRDYELILFRPKGMKRILGETYNRNYISWRKEKYLNEIIKKYQIELVYSFGKTIHQLAKIKREHPSLKIVHRIAGITEQIGIKVPKGKDAQLFKILEQADAFNFQSEHHEHSYLSSFHKMQRSFPNKEKLIHDIGIHSDYFHSSPTEPNPENPQRLLCCMRFSDRKRQDLIIQALGRSNNKNLEVYFAGAGPMLAKMKELAYKLEVEERCHFVGFLSRPMLINLMQSCQALVHPVDYEPQSKSVWEAMAMKLPIICSNVPALQQTIIPQETGILCENSVESWTQIFDSITNLKADLQYMAIKAFDQIAEIADPAKNAKKYESFFLSLID